MTQTNSRFITISARETFEEAFRLVGNAKIPLPGMQFTKSHQ